MFCFVGSLRLFFVGSNHKVHVLDLNYSVNQILTPALKVSDVRYLSETFKLLSKFFELHFLRTASLICLRMRQVRFAVLSALVWMTTCWLASADD